MAINVIFKQGTRAQYAAAQKVETTFYYITDEKKLYLGEKELTNEDLGGLEARLIAAEGALESLETIVGKDKTENTEASGILKDIQDLKESIENLDLGDNESLTTIVNNAVADKVGDIGDSETVVDYIDSVIKDGGLTQSEVEGIVAEKIAELLVAKDADESLDSLQEIADWIQQHPKDAAEMSSKIGGLEAKVEAMNLDKTDKDYVKSISQSDGKLTVETGTFDFEKAGVAASLIEDALSWGEI